MAQTKIIVISFGYLQRCKYDLIIRFILYYQIEELLGIQDSIYLKANIENITSHKLVFGIVLYVAIRSLITDT